jgi:hypothetical protein
MCCGSKRAAMRRTLTPSSAQSTAPLVPPSTPERAHIPGVHGHNPAATTVPVSARGPSLSVILHCVQASAIRVRGPVTGRQYDFSGARPAQAVEPRDAAVLMRTGLFRRA